MVLLQWCPDPKASPGIEPPGVRNPSGPQFLIREPINKAAEDSLVAGPGRWLAYRLLLLRAYQPFKGPDQALMGFSLHLPHGHSNQ